MSLRQPLTTLAVAIACALAVPLSTVQASSHREAPAITQTPKVDASDFYVFRSYESGRDGFITLIANYLPLQDAYGGPNYFSLDPNALYEIHIDNNGDAQEDLTFQFQFNQRLGNEGKGLAVPVGDVTTAVPLKNIGGIGTGDNSGTQNFYEDYTLTLVKGARRTGEATVANTPNGGQTFTKPLDFIGEKSFGSVAEYNTYADSFIHNFSLPDCNGKVFVGQRKDPFVVNLGETFDLVNNVPIEGDSAPGAGDGNGFPSGITQNANNDDLRHKNVTTLALEIPISCATGGNGDIVGAWTSASLRQARLLPTFSAATFSQPSVHGGEWSQVSRLSNPLVNEVVIGLPDKDRFNHSEPKDDGQFAQYVTHPSLPVLLNVLFLDGVNQLAGANFTHLAPTNLPRNDLVAAFLTGLEGVNKNGSVSEMLRLNTAVAPTARDAQATLGVVAGDNAGFPNGRRLGDDVVDIALRVVMGALCHANLGLCTPEDAPVGNQAFTDGAPISAADFGNAFPYVNPPLPGSPN